MSVINTHNFGRFWSISCTITHRFGGPRAISTFDDPGVRLRAGHQHSHIRPILVCFVHYYSAFWGPRAISTIDDPQGVFACPASILIVLANSDRFVDYYSLFLGHGVICIVVESQGSFGQFWSFSCTITHHFGVPERFPRLAIPGLR